MNFEEAEARFRELQARVQRGEPISRAEYEDQVSQLAVQDRNGVLWEINPRTGKWMYFDGAEWVSGTPPGHDTSAVIPAPGKFVGPPGATTQPAAAAPSPMPPAPSLTPPPPLSPQPPPPPPPPLSPPPPRPISTPVPPRPITPPTVGSPAGPKAAPEPLKPLVRPPSKSSAPPAPGGQPERTSPLAMFGPNREWVPLAIGAVVLLLCAVLLIGVSQFVLPKLGAVAQPTATRTLVPTLPSTPIPTVVRLPTLPPPTPTPSVVLATVTETRVNVRSAPNTKGKILSALKKGNQITLVGRLADNTWYQINIAGATAPAWVSAQTIQIASGDPNTLPVAGPTPTPTKSAAAARPAQPTPTSTQAPLGTLPSPTP